jgi:hypothetical protein
MIPMNEFIEANQVGSACTKVIATSNSVTILISGQDVPMHRPALRRISPSMRDQVIKSLVFITTVFRSFILHL